MYGSAAGVLPVLLGRLANGQGSGEQDYQPWNGDTVHIMRAVRDCLRSYFPNFQGFTMSADQAKGYIGEQIEGRPPASMGKWYIAIHDGGCAAEGQNDMIETYSIQVTVTHELQYVPADRSNSAKRNTVHGLNRIAQAIKLLIHGNQAVRIKANNSVLMPIEVGELWKTPLFFTGWGPERVESGEWAHCEPDARSFIVQTLNFNGCKAFYTPNFLRRGPMQVTASVSIGGAVTLDWNDRSLFETFHKIYRSNDYCSSWTLRDTIASNLQTWSESPGSGTWWYRVAIVDLEDVEYTSPPVVATV